MNCLTSFVATQFGAHGLVGEKAKTPRTDISHAFGEEGGLQVWGLSIHSLLTRARRRRQG